jgi:TnpA family transposase
MRRQQLTEAQITALLDPPTDQRELVRHYTLSAADLTAIRRCRGDHNRLGHALMLCYLRYPGRPLKAGERPPRPLLLFIAEQIDAPPESIEEYLAAERNRQRHVAELQDRLGFRPFGTRPAADLAGWLLPHAIENDRLVHLAAPEFAFKTATTRRVRCATEEKEILPIMLKSSSSSRVFKKSRRQVFTAPQFGAIRRFWV